MSIKRESKKKMKIRCSLKMKSRDLLLRGKEYNPFLQIKEKNQPSILKNLQADGPRKR